MKTREVWRDFDPRQATLSYLPYSISFSKMSSEEDMLPYIQGPPPISSALLTRW